MSSTPEQRDADQALTEAIARCSVAHFGESGRVLTEYVVVISRQGWDDDGDSVTSVETLHSDGDVPLHRCLGLVDYAAVRYRKHIAEG